MKVTFTTDDGYEVWVDTYQQSWTYSGLLAGRPNKHMNAGIIHWRLKSLEESWGTQRDIWINKKWYEMETLPPIMCAAWLVSDKLVPGDGDEVCGSHAFMVWFQEESDLAPSQAVMKAIGDHPWTKFAKNYDL